MPGGRCGLFPGITKRQQTQEYKQEMAERDLLREAGRSHLVELVRAERDGRLVVLPEVKDEDLKTFADDLHDYFSEAVQSDPSVGIFPPTDGWIALANALMGSIRHGEIPEGGF